MIDALLSVTIRLARLRRAHMEQPSLLAVIAAAFPLEPRPNMTLRQAGTAGNILDTVLLFIRIAHQQIRVPPKGFGHFADDYECWLRNQCFYPAVFTQLAKSLGALGGIPTMLWLLIKGAKVQPLDTQAS